MPPMEDFLAMLLPRPTDTVGHSGAITPNLLCATPNFVVLKKMFQTYDKNKNLSPKNVFFHPIR